MKNIILLTGNELRHRYFYNFLSNDPRFKVIKIICEGEQKSLERKVFQNPVATDYFNQI